MTLSFDTHPDRYKHWKLSVEGDIATLAMDVDPQGGLTPGYELKLNSYDLGVDIELADAVQRLRFEHPNVKSVVVTSANDRVFCAGANIPMLGSSAHAFKVNFCKFTNETRLSIEDASAKSQQKYLAAVNGPCAGGGYELALACDEILLVDDGASSVRLPEVPLLGVLPGTGGLTRLVDKRKVRRDRADVFCTTSEGIRGKRAVEWGLVDATAPKSKFADAVKAHAATLAKKSGAKSKGPGIALGPVAPRIEDGVFTYKFLTMKIDAAARRADVELRGPDGAQPKTADEIQAAGAMQWSLHAFRELDDALLRLRIEHLNIGLLVLRTRGSVDAVLAVDEALFQAREHWLANEILALQARVLRRLDLTSRSTFALVDQGSCFAGSLLELALACDRIYMLADDAEKVAVAISSLNGGLLLMSHGVSRLQARFLAEPARVERVLATKGLITTADADDLGLVTVAPDEIDWDDDVRIALEERASMSPDALTGMEASLRFAGPESCDSKIFARLSAWQNWIFQRPNAVGPQGALTKYGQPDRPTFDWKRC
ncbi:MAG: benzoyl-CoA-dihydrodiol lyase [Sandaracinaceae bacterium]|nr:benzoyl-CoA-dihydrodiol lyase [Sandaracinaceae bacterium]